MQRRVILAVFALGLACGAAMGMASAHAGKPRGAFLGVALLAQTLSLVEQQYVEAVSTDDLLLGAVRGMLRGLDPHSAILTPEDAALFEQDLEGKFGGVGLEVSIQGDELVVVAPMPGSPSEKAGIAPGDRIVAIDGHPAKAVDIEQAVRLMRGEPGTKVRLTLWRKTELVPFELELTRAVIEVAKVKAEKLADGYYQVVVPSFVDATARSLDELLSSLEGKDGGLAGVVLDLRRNPGGLVLEAVAVADLFLESGLIVSTRGKGAVVLDEYKARRGGTRESLALVTLIDSSSASASEIVAGALQDHGRSLIVGTRSFGKGSVQNVFGLDGGYALRLTVARYHTPAGRSIQAQGIEPDVVVESRTAPTRDVGELPGGAERFLPGHLAAQSSDKDEAEAVAPNDYPLQMAFQILRGLASADRAAKRRR